MSYKVEESTAAAHKRVELDKSKIVDAFSTIVKDKTKEKSRAANVYVRGAILESTTSCSDVTSQSTST